MREANLNLRRLPMTALLVIALVACGQTTPGRGNDGGGSGTIDYAPEPAPASNVIAYVAAGGDEIRLIDPDGSNDRRLWAHGLADPESVYDVWSMEWNTSATRLAFASTHENWCSLFASDIFYVGSDGSGYSRVTQAPACEQLDNFPQGTVQVPVKNWGLDSFSGFMYFQGAASIEAVNLPANGSGMVTFDNVADVGDGEDWQQVGTVIVGPNREISFSTIVDVAENSTVTTSEASVYTPSTFWEARSPTWSRTGNEVGFIYNFNSFTSLPVEPGPLEFGTALLAEDAILPGYTDHLSWGPTPETADSMLYFGSDSFDGVAAIYLVEKGSTSAGDPILTLNDSFEQVLDLAWLPDGSGFVFSLTDGVYDDATGHSDLYRYRFGDANAVALTDLSTSAEFAGRFSLSPDGQQIAFELATDISDSGFDLVDPDIWILDVDSGTAELLVEDARAPAWSW
ncbi:MAG TPA: hypothetical protein VF168_09045 [Trueperaceae bacterium]